MENYSGVDTHCSRFRSVPLAGPLRVTVSGVDRRMNRRIPPRFTYRLTPILEDPRAAF